VATFGIKPKVKTRRIECPYCEQSVEVGMRSMSIFCPHCRQRVILENIKIKTYHATRDFVTAGDVVVEKTGTLSAPTRVMSLTVKGKVWGNVAARRRVCVKRTGSIKGDVVTPSLIVDSGGELNGHCRIGVHDATISA